MERKVNVIEDLDGNKIVFIHDIQFKGKTSIEWSDVEEYLEQYVRDAHIIKSMNDRVYLDAVLPDEYTRFAFPVYGENGDIERYNVFHAIMPVR